jgi:hypothetical protein
MSDAGLEEPKDDVATQRPYDVDEADAAEQARDVELDEDEYR